MLSSVSLSLLDFPLDIRAAMENALARDESCGFGDDVYSMSVAGGKGGGGQAEGTGPKYSTDGPREILSKLLPAVHQQRETSRSVLHARSQMKPCGRVLARMSGRGGSRGGLRVCCSLGSSSPPLIIPAALQSGPRPPRHGPAVPARLRFRATNESKAELSHKRVCACVRARANSNVLYQSRRFI